MMTPQIKDIDQRPSTPETLPGTVSSCSLEEIATPLITTDARETQQNIVASPTANAPSSISSVRKLSAAIVTTPEASTHDFVAGRPTVSVKELEESAAMKNRSTNNVTPTKTPSKDFETPPPMPKPQKHHHRGVSTCSIPRRNRDTEVLGGSSSSFHKSLTRQTSTPSYSAYAELINDPHPLRFDAWAEAPATHYHVRGATYLQDRKKVASDEALFSLLTVDIVQTADNNPILAGLCNHPDERIQRALRLEKETGVKELPEFVWAINLAVPGPPFYHIMMYFGCDDMEALRDTSTPLGRLTKPFFFGTSDEFRDNTFKLVPKVVEGNFVVRKAVGTKPAILGRKLKQHYIRHPRFLELIVDISSDNIAKSVVGLSMGYAKQLVTDMMFVLEGDTEDTLPERMLAGARMKNLDFKKRDGTRVCHNYKA